MSNPDALNQFIAERVLKLTVQDATVPPLKMISNRYFTAEAARIWKSTYRHGCSIQLVPDYYHSFADCETILQKIEKDGWWGKWKCVGPEYYEFVMGAWDKQEVSADGGTRTAALVKCVARAYGWKGEE